MLAISIEFLHGGLRADPSGAASTGWLETGEWPPSPTRLFGALIAADGTGDRCRVTNGGELEWFERLPPPKIHADAFGNVSQTRLVDRYVVKAKAGFEKKSTPHSGEVRQQQEYVGRGVAQIRPGVRVAPRNSHVTYVWDVEASPDIVNALQLRCARVGYLGTSDSVVRMRATMSPPDIPSAECFCPDQNGDVAIQVPAAGQLAVWDRMYNAWAEHGPSISRNQYPALEHAVWYREPDNGKAETLSGRVVAWLRFGDFSNASEFRNASIPGRRISIVTSLFKAAVLSKYQEQFGEPPRELHGHGFKEKGYDTARYLALPDVGYRWSNGNIHGVALWMPTDTDQKVLAQTREAALAVRELVSSGFRVGIARHAVTDRPLAASPKRWRRKSKHWVTAFPALHERRIMLNLDEVRRWCRHAGLPNPVAFRAARKPLIRGAADLAPIEVNRTGKPGMPYSHVELLFDEPVSGPVVIGSGRQRGFGLCVSVEEGAI